MWLSLDMDAQVYALRECVVLFRLDKFDRAGSEVTLDYVRAADQQKH